MRIFQAFFVVWNFFMLFLPISMKLFTIISVFLVSCASPGTRINSGLLSGDWVNEKGLTVRIHRLADNRLGAEIISAPGFFSNDTGAGSVVLRNIRPFSNGYAADFIMPGNERPIQVRIRFLNHDTLLFQGNDKRIKGSRMIWERSPATKAGAKT